MSAESLAKARLEVIEGGTVEEVRTSFWLVKMMDLGIVVPIASAIGIGLLRGRAWAERLTFAMIGGYALLATSVSGMAITMQVNGDPDASLANVIVFGAFSLAFAVLAVALYRPLFQKAAPNATDGRLPDVSAPRSGVGVPSMTISALAGRCPELDGCWRAARPP